MLTPEYIINLVCQVLELDTDKMTIQGKQINQKYRDARLIAIFLMRDRIYDERMVMSKIEGKRVNVYSIKPLTYREISNAFNRKRPESAMASYLACRDLLKTNKVFRIKYQLAVEQLEREGSISIEKAINC